MYICHCLHALKTIRSHACMIGWEMGPKTECLSLCIPMFNARNSSDMSFVTYFLIALLGLQVNGCHPDNFGVVSLLPL